MPSRSTPSWPKFEIEITDSRGNFAIRLVRREPQRGQRPRREVLDQEIGAIEQARDKFAATRVLQVDRHAALVEIEKSEQPAAILDARAMRPQPAPALSRWRFDLDDVGAHVRQQLGRVRAGDEVSQIDDANVAERAVSHPLLLERADRSQHGGVAIFVDRIREHDCGADSRRA